MKNKSIDKFIIIATVLLEILGTFIMSYFKFTPNFINNFDNVVQNVLTIVSILLGFIFGLIGILIGMTSKNIFNKIKQSKLDSRLMLYIWIPLINGFISTVLSIIIGTFSDKGVYNAISIVIFNFWVCSNIMFLVFSLVLMIILVLLLKYLIVNNDPDEKS